MGRPFTLGRNRKKGKHRNTQQQEIYEARQARQQRRVTPVQNESSESESEESTRSNETTTNDNDNNDDAACQAVLLKKAFRDWTSGTLKHERAKNMAIAYLFVVVHGLPEDEKEWKGAGSVGVRIKRSLGLSDQFDITKTFRTILYFLDKGLPYHGQRLLKLPRPVKIPTNSEYAQLVADCMEDGMSIKQTMAVVNRHANDQGANPFTPSAIYSCMKRLNPKKIPVKIKTAGNYDADSDWAQRRYAFATQNLIRMGLLPDAGPLVPDGDQVDGEGNPVLIPPDWFYLDSFDEGMLAEHHSFKLFQVAFWDETHRKATIGDANAMAGRKHQLKFPRVNGEPGGKLDLINGEYTKDEESSSVTKVKFEGEIRLGLGCALLSDDENAVGVSLDPFVYTSKNVVTISDYEKKIRDEVRVACCFKFAEFLS